MDYIGSKQKINRWIFNKIKNRISNPTDYTFIDICSGSGSTSKYALQEEFNIISNDIMMFPSVIIKGYTISQPKKLLAIKIINKINQLKGIHGFFYDNYCEHSGRLYFTDINAMRIDACRQFIDDIDDEEIKNYLLYCGLEALSSISNTTGVQAAFLKQYKERSLKKFNLKEQPTIKTNNMVYTYCSDIIMLLKQKKIPNKSILYVDPPYNSRQYPPNYHLYETFVRYDNPELIGLTGLRKNWQSETKSEMCNKRGLIDTLKNVILYSNSEYIYISYSSDGLLSKNELNDSFKNLKIDINFYTLPTKRYKSDTSTNRKYDKSKLCEWLIEIKKRT